VSYRVRFEGKALVQLSGLPSAGFGAVVGRVADLVDEPWDAVVMTRGGDPAYRQVTFGPGYGLLTFRVDDADELIFVFDIAWIG
jgi:hypothetical protein